MERRLSAILVADVVDFTFLVQQDEERTINALKAHQGVLDPIVTSHTGRIVKSTGDGFLAEFASVVDAVKCANAMQAALSDNIIQPKLDFRMGIHSGDIVVDGDDILGDGVNIAARLEGIAEPGGIVISERVHDEVAGKLAMSFVDLGRHNLKNVKQPIHVYSIGSETAASDPVLDFTPSDIPSVAVLPFTNLSPLQEDEYFADGVVEEITAALSRIRDFFVISRQSAYSYKESSLDARQIGRELGVNYLVEGSVRRGGDQYRITVQLVETKSGTQLWSDRYEGDQSQQFDLQDSIASRVAGAINPSIRASEIRYAKRASPTNRDAYYIVLRAFPHFWAHRAEDNRTALDLFDEALKCDPDYGVALAYKAWCHAQQACYLWSEKPLNDRELAIQTAERAAIVVDDHAGALIAIGATYSIASTERELAKSFIDKALKIDPNNAWGWLRAGWLGVLFGDTENALENFERAMVLSPQDPFMFNVYFGMAAAHAKDGKLDTAISLVEKGLRAGPGVTWAYRMLAAFCTLAGDEDRASEAIDKLFEQNPGLTIERLKAGMPPGYVLSSPEYHGLLKALGVPEE